MSEFPICNIVLSSALPTDEIESLTLSIQSTSAQVQKNTSRIAGADDIALVISIVLGAIQIAEYGMKIAKAIIEWRKKARQKGIEPQGRLEHPDKPPLDLSTATDEEIKEWLSR